MKKVVLRRMTIKSFRERVEDKLLTNQEVIYTLHQLYKSGIKEFSSVTSWRQLPQILFDNKFENVILEVKSKEMIVSTDKIVFFKL